jgi:hypothetical protein
MTSYIDVVDAAVNQHRATMDDGVQIVAGPWEDSTALAVTGYLLR